MEEPHITLEDTMKIRREPATPVSSYAEIITGCNEWPYNMLPHKKEMSTEVLVSSRLFTWLLLTLLAVGSQPGFSNGL